MTWARLAPIFVNAARELRRRPGFALTAVLSVLGSGATSAVFSVVYRVLIDPFPYVDSNRMMQLGLRDPAGRFRYPGGVGAGLLAGVLLCVIFDSLASRWPTESARDPLILAGVTLLLLAVAVIACLAPARRAATIDPIAAVRHG